MPDWAYCGQIKVAKWPFVATRWQTQFVVVKHHNIFEVTKKLFLASSHHSMLKSNITTFKSHIADKFWQP